VQLWACITRQSVTVWHLRQSVDLPVSLCRRDVERGAYQEDVDARRLCPDCRDRGWYVAWDGVTRVEEPPPVVVEEELTS
jgi:hypothetical protein